MHCTAVTAAPEWGEALEYNIYALIYMYTHNALALKGKHCMIVIEMMLK